MAKREYFLIIDTETTMTDRVADFAAVIVDRKGKIYNQCAILVNGIYTDMENHPLFFNEDAGELWTKASLARRYDVYSNMVTSGSRMVASVGAINRWLDAAKAKYDPYLTAYNVSFDRDKCSKTGIDLTPFAEKTFCLWHAAANKWAHTKAYRNFVLQVHAFNNPTKLGNMTFKTNAETMARFVLDMPNLEDEPHTALEDILYYELPIFVKLLSTSKDKAWLNPSATTWRNNQVKDWFTAK